MDTKHYNPDLQRQRINRDFSKSTFNPQFIYYQIQTYTLSIQLDFCKLHLITYQFVSIYKYKLVLYITYQLLVWTDLRETSCKHWLLQVITLYSQQNEKDLYRVFRIYLCSVHAQNKASQSWWISSRSRRALFLKTWRIEECLERKYHLAISVYAIKHNLFLKISIFFCF